MPKSILKTFDYSFRSFLKHRVNGGMVLMAVAVLAMVIANSPWAEAYHAFWSKPVSLQIGSFNLFSHHGTPLTLMAFINDALMAIFFFSVGLEIKREILVGELSTLRKALLPIIAAVGGMIFPVVIYSLMTAGTPALKGLAIPMATDIAFSLGVLSLLGARIPLALKIFLTAFAVVDDIGGILIIAFFYTAHLEVSSLLIGLGLLLVLVAANRMQVMMHGFYWILGIVVWYFFLQSGVHATIAGVLVAFTIPASPSIGIAKYIARIQANVAEFPRFDKELDEAENNQNSQNQSTHDQGINNQSTDNQNLNHQIPHNQTLNNQNTESLQTNAEAQSQSATVQNTLMQTANGQAQANQRPSILGMFGKSKDKNANSNILLTHHQIDVLKSIESASDHVISPLQYMEDRMHRVVNYLIMPLFAFANAGITLGGAEGAGFGQITLAVILGLVFGKFIGIFLFTWLAVRSKVTLLPEGVNWKNIAGVSMLGGIGFTVSLFIANLSFGADNVELLNQAKLGVLLGTVIAGGLGYFVLRATLPKAPIEEKDLLED